MEKREIKAKKHKKSRRSIWLALILAALILAAAYLCFFVFEIMPLPWAKSTEAVETTPAPTATPEPEPTPQPTLYIPKPEVNMYTAKLWAEEESIRGGLRVHYINTAADTIYSVLFHLYPNTVTPGALSVNRLTLAGKEAYYVMDGDKLNVPMAVELAPGEDCAIYMEFEVDLYEGEYGEDGKLGYLLPAVGVYENGWLMDALPGDAAFTAPATYSVIVEGEAECGIPESEPGHYYGENLQGLTVTLE